MTFNFFSKNGKLLPLSEAVVSVFNIEYAYGFGVYENIRVQDRLPYFLGDHIDRLLTSAQVIELQHKLSKNEIGLSVTALVEAITSNPPSEGGTRGVLATFNLKILLIGAREPSSVELFILPLAPLFPDRKLYKKGAMVMTIPYERFLPRAKTLNMLPSYYYYTEAKAKGYYDVLFADIQGNILEGSRTNFFAIKNRTIFTAPTEKVLEGVTKKHVLQVAREHGFEIQEQDIPLKNLGEFDGAFLTSTSSKIVPLRQIDVPSETSPYPLLCQGEGAAPIPSRLGRPKALRGGVESGKRGLEFATITPTIKELMKSFDEFLEEYRRNGERIPPPLSSP